MRYAAFVSYSHEADTGRARSLRQALHTFAKPWNGVRALRVFLDDAALSADPGLWSSVEKALGDSAFLVLMASPESARSRWVAKEISWWRRGPRAKNLLLVVTGGELHWDHAAQDFDWERSTCLPSALSGLFDEEPRWVDLRWMSEDHPGDLDEPRFRACVADLAAPLHGRPKDELIGEDVAQRRRFQRFRRGMFAGLAVLTVVAVLVAIYAVVQQNAAERQASIASARLLATTAIDESSENATKAALLAAEGYRIHQDSQTRSALFRVLNDNPDLARQHVLSAPVTSLVASANGVVFAGTADGRLVRWNPRTDAVSRKRLGKGSITDVATDEKGSVVAASDGHGVVLWHPGAETRKLEHPDPGPVAVSPDGDTTAVLSGDSADVRRLSVFETSNGKRTRQIESGAWEVGFPDSHTLALVDGNGEWRQLRLPGLKVVHRQDEEVFPPTRGERGISQNGSFAGYVGSGGGDITSTDKSTSSFESFGVSDPFTPHALAIRGDGKKVAASGGGRLFLAKPAAKPRDTDNAELTGAGGAEEMAFIGDSDRLVTAKDATLSLWDPGQRSRMRRDDGNLKVPETTASSLDTRMALSPDGHRALIVGGQGEIVLHDLRRGPDASVTVKPPKTVVDPVRGSGTFFPDWTPDGGPVLIGDHGSLHEVHGSRTERLVEGEGAYDAAARLTADGERLSEVSEYGGMSSQQLKDGRHVDHVSARPVQKGTSGSVQTAAIRAEGRYAAWIEPDEEGDENAGWGGRLFVADGERGRKFHVPGRARSVAFAGDRLLVGRVGGSLEVRDLTGTRLVRRIPGATEFTVPMAWVPGTSFAGWLRNDGTVVVLDIDTGATLGELEVPTGPTFATNRWAATALVGVGKTGELVAASPKGEVARWAITGPALLDLACRFANRDLGAGEWREVLGADPPGDLRCRR